MKGTATRSVSIADAALVVGGAWLIGLGLYFIVLRPPFLPEDERFIGRSLQEATVALPALVAWLGHVFGVLGGFAAGLGGLVVWLVSAGATTCVRRGGAVAGFAVCTWMAIVNFTLQSDFRWMLAAAVLPWLIALAALFAERESNGSGSN
jgi:hypothetical protein